MTNDSEPDAIETIEMTPEQARAYNAPLIEMVRTLCMELEAQGYAAEALLSCMRFCVINYALILEDADGIPAKASVRETLGMLAGLLRMNGDM